MTRPNTLLLTATLLCSATAALAQPAGLTADHFSDMPLSTVAKSQHNGPSKAVQGTLLKSRPELLRFFSPSGKLQRIPPNWQRQMVLGMATGQAGKDVQILRVVKRTSPTGKLIGLTVSYRLSAITHANRFAAQPMHLVAIDRLSLNANQIRWTTGAPIDPRAMSAGSAGLPLPKPETATNRPLPKPAPSPRPLKPASNNTIPIRGTIAKAAHYGPTARRARFVTSRNEYLQFFATGGQRQEKPEVFWTGGQRVVAVADGQGGGDVEIVRLRQIGSVIQADVRRTPRSAARLGAPYHAVRIDSKDLTGPVTKVEVNLVSQPTAPSRSSLKIKTVAHSRYYGPTTTKASLVTSRNAYLQFFAPGGQRSEAPQVFWTGGENVVAISSGQGEREIMIVSLRQEGSTLIATVRERALPDHMGNRAAPYHAVKFRSQDLTGPVTKLVVVGQKDRPLLRFAPRPSEGLSGAIQQR